MISQYDLDRKIDKLNNVNYHTVYNVVKNEAPIRNEIELKYNELFEMLRGQKASQKQGIDFKYIVQIQFRNTCVIIQTRKNDE